MGSPMYTHKLSMGMDPPHFAYRAQTDRLCCNRHWRGTMHQRRTKCLSEAELSLNAQQQQSTRLKQSRASEVDNSVRSMHQGRR